MYYFIVNPNSRSGKGLEIWNRLKTKLEQKQIPYRAYLTEHTGHAAELAAEISSPRFEDPEAKVLVALGGDGTLNEVVNGLSLSHSVSLAYIPCGSGNDFARGMKLAKTPEKLLNRLLDGGECRYIDYGILTYMKEHPSHRRFVVSAGIGFDADVCRNMFTTKLKGTLNRLHIGKLAYLLIGIKRIVLCKSADGVLTLDGIKKMRLHRIRFISFHNQKFEGGGFRFAPAAIPDDGYLNLCIVSGVSRLGLTKILLASLSGKHTLCNGVRSYTCKEAQLQIDQPLEVHADGESCFPQTEISVRCERQRLRLIL